jgi:hypothetical protein
VTVPPPSRSPVTSSYLKWGWQAYWTISYMGQYECFSNALAPVEEDAEVDAGLDGGVGGETMVIALDGITTAGAGD